MALDALERHGPNDFLQANDGEGWFPPEAVRLRDLDLGRGSDAEELRPVLSRLGARFSDWQLEASRDESWDELHVYASKLRLVRTWCGDTQT